MHSKLIEQILYGQLYIAEDRAQKSRANRFTSMHGDSCHPSVCMPQKNMAAAGANDLKAHPLKYYLLALQARKAGHTEIC